MNIRKLVAGHREADFVSRFLFFVARFCLSIRCGPRDPSARVAAPRHLRKGAQSAEHFASSCRGGGVPKSDNATWSYKKFVDMLNQKMLGRGMRELARGEALQLFFTAVNMRSCPRVRTATKPAHRLRGGAVVRCCIWRRCAGVGFPGKGHCRWHPTNDDAMSGFVDPGSSRWRRFTFQLPQSLGERGVVDGDDVAPRGLQGVDPAGLDS